LKKLKNNKKIVILGISIVVILFIVLLFFVLRPQIKFNKNFKEIEYGTEYTYEDMIKSVQPKDAEIIYPEVLATEVGKYELTFNFKKDDKVYSDQFSFVIKDTKTPKLTLYFMDENIQVRLNDTNVDVLSNIHIIENLNEQALLNKVELKEKDFNKLVEDIKTANQNINAREITNTKNIKDIDIQKNGIYYTTDLDVTKVGTYTIKVCVVDENYNSVETKWNLDVIESDQVLNSGGNVSCTYNGDDLKGNEVYSITSVENYKYDPFKLVTEYEIITVVTFSDDYDTQDNIKLMMNELNEDYNGYNDIEGVVVDISNKDNVVTTSIKINLLEYDKKADKLGILVNDSNSEIDVMSIINSAEDNKYVCTIK